VQFGGLAAVFYAVQMLSGVYRGHRDFLDAAHGGLAAGALFGWSRESRFACCRAAAGHRRCLLLSVLTRWHEACRLIVLVVLCNPAMHVMLPGAPASS
jgi:hypothetical protein